MTLDNEQVVRKAYQMLKTKTSRDGSRLSPATAHSPTSPLHLPFGTLPPTGKRMDAPCCDVFELSGGKIKRFDCYPEGSVILTQLGVIGNLGAALKQ